MQIICQKLYTTPVTGSNVANRVELLVLGVKSQSSEVRVNQASPSPILANPIHLLCRMVCAGASETLDIPPTPQVRRLKMKYNLC